MIITPQTQSNEPAQNKRTESILLPGLLARPSNSDEEAILTPVAVALPVGLAAADKVDAGCAGIYVGVVDADVTVGVIIYTDLFFAAAEVISLQEEDRISEGGVEQSPKRHLIPETISEPTDEMSLITLSMPSTIIVTASPGSLTRSSMRVTTSSPSFSMSVRIAVAKSGRSWMKLVSASKSSSTSPTMSSAMSLIACGISPSMISQMNWPASCSEFSRSETTLLEISLKRWA